MHHANTMHGGFGRAVQANELVPQQHLALPRLHQSGHDFEQRGFTRAILAPQTHHLALAKAEIDRLERDNATERLSDAADFQKIRHLTILSLRRRCRPLIATTVTMTAPLMMLRT